MIVTASVVWWSEFLATDPEVMLWYCLGLIPMAMIGLVTKMKWSGLQYLPVCALSPQDISDPSDSYRYNTIAAHGMILLESLILPLSCPLGYVETLLVTPCILSR
jgi:hypothetical protein